MSADDTTDSEEVDRRTALQIAATKSEATAHLILAWRPGPPHYKVQTVETEQSISATFLGYARNASSSLVARSPIPYDPEWPLKDYEFFDLAPDELPGADLFEQLEDFLNLPAFTRNNLTKPRLYVVAVQTPDGNAFFGRKMASLRVLGRKKGVFSAVWNGSTFSKLEESVATFSMGFDWVFWQGHMYVVDAGAFHAEFRDAKALQAKVEEHVLAIQTHVKIEGANEFVKRCQSSIPMASKLKRVAEKGIQHWGRAKLKQYAQDYTLDVKWGGADDNDLVFEGTLEGQWKILKLLDEDRTRGPVSGRHYESAAKRTV